MGKSSLPLCNAIKRRRDAPFPPIPVTGGDGESPAASASPRRFSVFGKVWVLCATITPVYDFVCFHPYWERRRERHRQEREASSHEMI
ncbi:hypothetical protein P8452_07399 [Trifolium repens]|nr:hypothetical protein P8452_07399 [Trifolium repens]